jgi:hypothetical protein
MEKDSLMGFIRQGKKTVKNKIGIRKKKSLVSSLISRRSFPIIAKRHRRTKLKEAGFTTKPNNIKS